jgi:hypothetical protein
MREFESKGVENTLRKVNKAMSDALKANPEE